MGGLQTNFCASPARLRKAFVTSVLVTLPEARRSRRSSGLVSVILISAFDSSSAGNFDTFKGSSEGTSGMVGFTCSIDLSLRSCAIWAISCHDLLDILSNVQGDVVESRLGSHV
jgi:hypothetical protein